MTTQQASGAIQRRQYVPNPRPAKGRSGNYHRIHQAILERADRDGVFHTTKTAHEILKEIKASPSSVTSTIFQWSDPTGVHGVRRVRLYSPRNCAADPPEMTDDKVKKSSPDNPTKSTGWAKGVFSPPPPANKDGPFYLPTGQKRLGGVPRTEQIRFELKKVATKIADHKGRWSLVDAVRDMADLGFPAGSVYRLVGSDVKAGLIEKVGSRRRHVAVKIDPLSDPNSFKGPKTQDMIDQERGINTEVQNDPPASKAEALDGLITQLVQKRLEQPETLSLIDAFIKARVEEVIRRQLGL